MIDFSGESSGLSPSGVSPTCDGENKYVTGKARLELFNDQTQLCFCKQAFLLNLTNLQAAKNIFNTF